MGSPLPFVPEDRFRARLAEAAVQFTGSALPDAGAAGRALYQHYLELRRWNSRISLIGPGTAAEVIDRHYGESLAALPLIGPDDRRLVDVGSGAGFPGFVLAASRPALDVTLVDSRQRKWLFLKTAVRRSRLSCRCLNARVEGRSVPPDLPDEIDLVTSRAVALSSEFFDAFDRHSPAVRFLIWHGTGRPELPDRFEVRREIGLAGSHGRRILEILSTTPS